MLPFLVFLFALEGACNALSPPLGSYGADSEQVSISGVSSGAYMAVQVQVAFSKTIMGVGVVAGGPYYCAQASTTIALTECMTLPSLINVAYLQQVTRNTQWTYTIDPVSNMENDMVYLYSGTNDHTVVRGVMNALDSYYGDFVDQSNVKRVFNMPSGHALITDNYGNECSTSKKPWINNCGYNQAYELLNHIYGGNLVKPDSSTIATGINPSPEAPPPPRHNQVPQKRKRGRPKAVRPVPNEKPEAMPQRPDSDHEEVLAEEREKMQEWMLQRAPEIARLEKKKRTPQEDATLQTLLRRNEEDNHLLTGEWKWEEFDTEMEYRNDGITFTGDGPGISEAAQRANSVLDCFQLFFTNKVLDNIVTQTNLYAQQLREAGEGPKETWVPVGREDILGFLGVAVGMSLLQKSDVRDYWTGKEILETLWFPSVMSGRRFRAIQRCLHLADNTVADLTPEGYFADKLYKVRPLLNSLTSSFRQHFRPNRELSIDEQMIGTKARCSFIQHMKDKPTKRGIKVWALCDSKVHYCLNFQVYTGGSGETGLAFRVVNELMYHYLGKGHHVYFDNFYTSPDLMAHLLYYNTLAVGTVRQNLQHMSLRLQSKYCDVPVGESLFLQSHGMTACRWKDKRDVFCLSTVHGNTMKTITRRKSGGHGRQEEVQKPLAVCDYNIYMGGVDVYDQLLSYHPSVRRYKRWWIKLFWRLFDMSVLNALALWKLKNPDLPRGHHKLFKTQLAMQLVAPLKERNVPVRPRFGVADRLQHYGTPINFPTQKACAVCRDKNKKITFGCELCGDGVRLHKSRGDGQPCCFVVYHTVANYR